MLRSPIFKRSSYALNLTKRSFAKEPSFKNNQEAFDDKKAETESLARFLQTAQRAAG